jgi:hypothetical protein
VNTTHLAPPAVRLRVGQAVHVNAYTGWHPATVTFVTHARVGVTYHPGGLPAPYTGPVAPHVIRPADGIRLRPASAVRPGDRVVAFDNTRHLVDLVWRARDGWYVIAYAGGGYATVPPGAILRLADPATVAGGRS